MEKFVFNDKVYNVLKWVAIIVLPAAGTLYLTLANTWGFPYGEEVMKTATGIQTFLGAVLCIENAIYKKTQKKVD